jgi:hypothetical protein
MLAATDRVIELVRRAVLAGNLPDGAGLRITVERELGDTTTFGAMLAPCPQSTDTTLIFSQDVRLFLAPSASTKLSDKLLDVHVEANEVKFEVTDQQEPDEAAAAPRSFAG